jgi:hypothetical protein
MLLSGAFEANSDEPDEVEPWSYTLRSGVREIQIPGLGKSKEESYKIVRQEYTPLFLDIAGLDFGGPSKEPGTDGQYLERANRPDLGPTSFSHIGGKPVLYIRDPGDSVPGLPEPPGWNEIV